MMHVEDMSNLATDLLMMHVSFFFLVEVMLNKCFVQEILHLTFLFNCLEQRTCQNKKSYAQVTSR